jgi:YbbR-like protein
MRVPSAIQHNFGLKLASLALGILVYVHVTTEQVQERQVWMPITLTRLPGDLALMSSEPGRARVLLRGHGKELLKLKWQSATIEIDLSDASPGRFIHSPSASDVRLPPQSTVIPVAILEPRHVALEIDRIATRETPLAPRFSGAPPAGYWLKECKLSPARVRVRGPARLLADTDTLIVGPIDLRQFRSEATGTFPVEQPDRRLTIEPSHVQVTIGVERVSTRDLDGVRVRALVDRGQVCAVEPAAIPVRLAGPRAQLARLSGPQLSVAVDARGLGPGEHELPALADTTADGVSVTPLAAKVRVRIGERSAAKEGRAGGRAPVEAGLR